MSAPFQSSIGAAVHEVWGSSYVGESAMTDLIVSHASGWILPSFHEGMLLGGGSVKF
jgi:hypothetical protein